MKRFNFIIMLIIITLLLTLFCTCTLQGSGGGGSSSGGDGSDINSIYTVTYNGNGNTGGSVPIDNTSYTESQIVTVLGNTGNLERGGYSFAGWNTQADGNGITYIQGHTFIISNSNVTLYAKWGPVYNIRNVGPAGGWIFYDKGYCSDGWRYLEMAPWQAGIDIIWGTWGYTVNGADGTAIGTGKQNTLDIITNDLAINKAADLCANFNIEEGGVIYDDWFLPSIDELQLIYTEIHLHGIYDLCDLYYWSSSEDNDNKFAWYLYAFNGSIGRNGKGFGYLAHPVRAF